MFGLSQVPDQGWRRRVHRPFDAVFQARGIRILASPPQPPRANAICERVTVTLHRELPGRLLLVDEHHLRRVLTEDLRHCNTALPHRALSQPAPGQARVRPPQINLAAHRIHRNQVLGGLIHEYQVAAGQLQAVIRRGRLPPRSCIRARQAGGGGLGGPPAGFPAGARHGAQEQGAAAFTYRRA